MNKYEKELMQHQLTSEEKELNELKKIYRQALAEIDDNIARLLGRADADMQHVIYRVDYQRALKGQISGILDAMNSKQFESISQYMAECYENGFVGTAYALANQGIPLIIPIDQKEVAKALKNDSKISGSLYTKLGEDVDDLKKRISSSVSRGIASGKGYSEMAKDIKAISNIGFNKAVRIARTEGARVHNTASHDAALKAKTKGANVVKQWNSTLDKNTRNSHRRLDGQIRELDEKFSNGLMHPCDPAGKAEEVINCRCSLLQRAKWALDEDELQTLQERAAYFELDKTEDFDDFKKKYLKAAEITEKEAQRAAQQIAERTTFVPAKTIEEAQEYAQQFCQNEMMARTFKGEINYKGISVENANEINLALTKVFNQVGLQKVSGIKAVSPTSAVGKKAFKSGSDAVFSYSPVEHGIYINKEILKNNKAFADYVAKADDAWKLVMTNIDNLSERTKELALTYKNAGRDLVDGKTIEGLFTHELGHHAQWTLLDVKTINSVGDNWRDYAPKLSGYANASKSEYLAESFVAYMKGETDLLDPEYVAALSKKTVEKTVKSGIILSQNEYVKIMPDSKFVDYALNPLKEPNKAKAFKKALGYTQDNYQELKEQITKHADESKFVAKGDSGYGMRYEYIMEITGANNKKANVLTAWIQDGEEKRLTSVYVTNRKVTE